MVEFTSQDAVLKPETAVAGRVAHPSSVAAVLRKTVAMLVIGATLAGCVATNQASDKIATTSAEAERVWAARAAAKPVEVQNVNWHDQIYAGRRSIPYEHGEPLPSNDRTRNIKFSPGSARSLDEVADVLFRATGIPVIVDMTGADGEAPEDPAAAGGARPSLPTPPFGFAPPGAVGVAQPAAEVTPVMSVERLINYTGNLRGLLDEIAMVYDVHWQFSRGRIELNRFITRTMTVAALAGTADVSTGTESTTEDEGDGSQSSIGQSLQTKAKLDIWAELDTQMKTMLPSGSRYSLAPSMNTITVTTTPSGMRVAEQVIDHQNAILGRMIAMSVKVYKVTVTAADNYGIDLQGVLADIGNGYFSGALGGPALAAVAGAGTIGLTTLRGNAAGSDVVFQALSKAGDTSLYKTLSVTALNGRPVQQLILDRQSYVESVTAEATDGAVGLTIEPAEIVYGTSLLVTPMIMDDGEIFMDLALGISNLDGIDTFSQDGSSVQQPRVSQRSNKSQIRIRSGQTIVLTGLESSDASREKSGMGHPDFMLFGGSRGGSSDREIFVIAITPTVM